MLMRTAEPSPTRVAQTLTKMGEICEERMGRADTARRHYERAIAVDPSAAEEPVGLRAHRRPRRRAELGGGDLPIA